MTNEIEQPNKAGIDLLHGCPAITEFVFGNRDSKNVRKIYRLSENSDFPTFKMGGVLCARASTLMSYFEKKERRAHASR